MNTTTTAELLECLRRHYIPDSQQLPGGVFVPEVGWNGVYGDGRRADALFVGFTSASGRVFVGHELKISRSDWLRELAKPAKADQWADQCHEWWIVVSDPAIVHDGELPEGWGLMSPPAGRSRTRMTIHTKAARKTAHTPSWDALRSFLARLDTLRAQEIANNLRAAHTAAAEKARAQIERELSHRRGPDAADLGKKLAALEKALGVPIDWDGRGFRGISTQELADIAALARNRPALRSAIGAFTNRWHDPIDATRKQLDQLEAALGQLRAIDATLMDTHETPRAAS